MMLIYLMRLCDVCLGMCCPYSISVENTKGDVSDHNDIMCCGYILGQLSAHLFQPVRNAAVARGF